MREIETEMENTENKKTKLKVKRDARRQCSGAEGVTERGRGWRGGGDSISLEPGSR